MRLRLLVAYDGTDFHGVAANRDVRTVAQTLLDALVRVTPGLRREPTGGPGWAPPSHPPPTLVVAGRTDAGVHASGQVVHIDLPPSPGGTEPDLETLRRRLNGVLPGDVAVRRIDLAPADFDARFSARWRRYRYTLVDHPAPDPLRRTQAWWVGGPLDVGLLQQAVDPLVGEHEFSGFCRRPTPGRDGRVPSLVRRIEEAVWSRPEAGVVWLDIRASSFCHNMVRSIVGTAVDVALGRRTVVDVVAARDTGDRSRAGKVAPPHGLCLMEVGYDPDPVGHRA